MDNLSVTFAIGGALLLGGAAQMVSNNWVIGAMVFFGIVACQLAVVLRLTK